MQALLAYLRLRWRLLGRQLLEIGWVRLAILIPVLVAVGGRVVITAAAHPQVQWAVPVGVALLLVSAHRQRSDWRFLVISAPHFRRWLAVEYLFWASPVAMVLLLFKDWGAAALTLGLAPLAALAPPMGETQSTRQKGRSLFRSEAFEWVSGMRAGGAWVVWPALLAAAIWQRGTPLGPVLALGGWLLVLLAYYGVPEPMTMLVLAARGPGPFLRRRLLLGLTYAGLSAAPFLWLLASGPAGVGGALAVGLAWLGLVGLIIITKYAFYPNALHIRTTQALVVGMALAMPGNPVYPALLLVAAGGLIWQSRRRLRAVLGTRGKQ
ncbi:hypothetical protein [Hymenobacter terrenus]|uniref:hypothetical protein n=1 Tax=Hymenobacter terrenus TaxID=1629124 RepID=UPI0006191FE3|nr:hypothetical protein [Hymenobacter terrenus]